MEHLDIGGITVIVDEIKNIYLYLSISHLVHRKTKEGTYKENSNDK